MGKATPEQWSSIVEAYKNEKRENGDHVSCKQLAARHGMNVSSVMLGLKNRGVKLRVSGGRKKTYIGPDRSTEDIARAANSKPTSISIDLRRRAQVEALRGLLTDRKGRIYLREIELAFGCSCFESAKIAQDVAATGIGVCSFEASQGHKGARLFVEWSQPVTIGTPVATSALSALADIEKAHILETIRRNPLMSRKAMAVRLGIGERTLYRRLVDYGLVWGEEVPPEEELEPAGKVESA